jgi:hypothetical protein
VRAILLFLRTKVRVSRRLEFGTSIILSSNICLICARTALLTEKWYRATVSKQRLSRRYFTLILKNIASAWLRCQKFRILDEHIKQSTFFSAFKQLVYLTFKNR